MMRIFRAIPLGTALVIGLLTASPAWSCSCARTSAEEMYERVNAVLEGRVIDVNRGYLRLAWCAVRHLFGSDLDDYEDACGIRVTLEVSRCWKGSCEGSVFIATGRGGGDCGVPFQEGKSYLLYLEAVRPSLFGTNICMRPQLVEDASGDREILAVLTTSRGQ